LSYLVLARKYRPQGFDGIVGQEHAVRTLKNAIRLDRVHHAFLFTGARGVGKTTTARVLARALNCEQGPTAEPCDSCASCAEIRAGTSPDVLEIDGASNTGVDNVRELRENVRYLPSRGRFKLYIIDEVHMLSQAAFNALLKTLEEPPAHVKFIFATTEPQKIPITILSRCQRFDFRRVSTQVLAEHLRVILDQEGVTLGSEALTAIVREAQGSVRDALSLLDQVLSYAGDTPDEAQVIEALGVVDRQTIFDLCSTILDRDANSLLHLVAEVDARGHDLADASALLVEHMRDLTVAKVAQDPAAVLLERSPGELEALVAQAGKASSADLHRMFAIMAGVAEDVARSSFARITFEMGLLRLLEVEPSQNLANLIERLDGLVGGSQPVNAKAPSTRPPTPAPQAEARPQGGKAEPVPARSAPAAPPAAVEKSGPPQPAKQPPAPTPPAPQGEGNASADAAGKATGDHAGQWAEVVERVRGKRPAAASFLEYARLMHFDDHKIELGFVPGTFYWNEMRQEENRKLLLEAIQEQTGARVEIALFALDKEAAEAPDSLASARERSRDERLEAIDRDGRSHPAVQSATRILGGEVKKVVPLATEEAAGQAADESSH